MSEFKNTVLGAVSVIVKDSNHNSDFDSPRIVDGVLTASDKSLKYYVRHFLHDSDIANIFYKKDYDKNQKVIDISQKLAILEIKKITEYFDFIDNKFFGYVIQPNKKAKKNELDLSSNSRGILQLSYGCNIWKDNSFKNHTITSQFNSGNDGGQSTIGSEYKVNKANYIHNFKMFPEQIKKDNYIKSLFGEHDLPFVTETEVENIKYAFSHCVGSSVKGSYFSAAKSNTKIGLCVYVTLKEKCDVNIDINNTIHCSEDYNIYNIDKLIDICEKNKENIEYVDIAYTDGTTDIENIDNLLNNDFYHIHTGGYKRKGIK